MTADIEQSRVSELNESGGRSVLLRDPKTVLLDLPRGEEIPEHSHPGERIMAYVVEGVLDLEIDGSSHTLRTGDCIGFEGDSRISPSAVEDCRAILVFVPDS